MTKNPGKWMVKQRKPTKRIGGKNLNQRTKNSQKTVQKLQNKNAKKNAVLKNQKIIDLKNKQKMPVLKIARAKTFLVKTQKKFNI